MSDRPTGSEQATTPNAAAETDPESEWLSAVIGSRCTVHNYDAAPVPESLVERALELWMAAPNHHMTEPWRFVLVGKESRSRLADIAVDIKQAKKPLSEKAESDVRAKIETPPVLIVPCRVRHDKPDVEREDYAALACGAQNAMLWFWAHGFGSKWSTGAVTTAPDTYSLLGVPKEHEIVGFMWVGRASSECQKPRRKLSLPDALRRVP
jgi:nitroreductase